MNQNWNITRARDTLELIVLFQGQAREARGIELHPEVEIIGEDI
jgi:UDP-N-acetylenolpyruvoylglucosamine reductase